MGSSRVVGTAMRPDRLGQSHKKHDGVLCLPLDELLRAIVPGAPLP